MAAEKSSPAHLAYLVTLMVKGFDGAVEILSGLVILLTGPQRDLSLGGACHRAQTV